MKRRMSSSASFVSINQARRAWTLLLPGAMALNRRRLGTTDLDISTVGFGAWAIGGGGWAYGWGPQDDAGSVAAIRHAVARGVNWIDTAAIYGFGHSEEVVGRALREIPPSERPFVFTKCGMIPDLERPYEEPVRDLRPASNPARGRGFAPAPWRRAD